MNDEIATNIWRKDGIQGKMANHKDISRAHALLNGEGWHIENTGLQRKTNRKHKSRCIHYDKNTKTCKLMHNKINLCVGSAECPTYREY